MPVIKVWLDDAVKQLTSLGIDSAQLDAEILLSNTLGKNRTYLHANCEQLISDKDVISANNSLRLRLQRIPVAYITGFKEFYGRSFIVSPHTLIPRPESEVVIDTLLEIYKTIKPDEEKTLKLIDVGTGTGCLGITAKLEIPNLDITLVDLDQKALDIASRNAASLSAEVNIIKSDLLDNVDGKFDLILANLPYVDRSWDRSAETSYEPKHALFADNFGKSVIINLIKQTPKCLKDSGYIIIEADPRQHHSLIEEAFNYSLRLTSQQGYVIAFRNAID